MPRLSIEISDQQHQQLKAIAALNGKSIKDFVLEKTLSDAPDTANMSEKEALNALADYLRPSIEEARNGDVAPFDFEEFLARKRAQVSNK